MAAPRWNIWKLVLQHPSVIKEVQRLWPKVTKLPSPILHFRPHQLHFSRDDQKQSISARQIPLAFWFCCRKKKRYYHIIFFSVLLMTWYHLQACIKMLILCLNGDFTMYPYSPSCMLKGLLGLYSARCTHLYTTFTAHEQASFCTYLPGRFFHGWIVL